MARHIIPFPVRNSYSAPRSHDALARDTQGQAVRIAAQVEEELARRAQRMSTGARHSRVRANVLAMPAAILEKAKQPSRLSVRLGLIGNYIRRLVVRF